MALRALLVSILLVLAAPAAASADALLPPAGKVFHGVASGDSIGDFQGRTGRHPAVWQHWIRWGSSFRYAMDRARGTRTRLMLHLGTSSGQNLPGVISPGAIARGAGDRYLLGLNRTLAGYGGPVYLRPFGEMNNCDLPYSSHDCNGRRRDGDHTAGQFKRAWKRLAIVVRGGAVADMNARLRAAGMPGLEVRAAELPRPQVALIWSPMTGGSPMIGALRPGAFWPGGAYVDWVGTSFYSKFPNFRWLTPFYERFAARHRKPFALAEWAMWGADDASFARRVFAWMRSHPRTRMAIYNQGALTDGPFRLRRHPAAAAVIRRALRAPRFAELAPEYR